MRTIEVLKEGKGRKIEVERNSQFLYKSGSIFKILKEWYNLKKAFQLKLKVPHPIKFVRLSLFKAQIVMSYIEGKTLEELIPNLKYIEKLRIANELGKMLRILNNQKLCHQDLHKGNIIVSKDNEIFLLDWYKLKKYLTKNKAQINQMITLYGSFIKELNLKLILSFLKGYFGNYKQAKKFIECFGTYIQQQGIKKIIKILKKEVTNLENERRFKKIYFKNWKGYISIRTNGINYEKEILHWLKHYQEDNIILGEILKNGRSSLLVKYNDLCFKLFKRRIHKLKGLKDVFLYIIKSNRVRKSFFNSYLFFFITHFTPAPLAFFENKKGEGLLVTYYIKNSLNFAKLLDNLSNQERKRYINKLLKWYKKVLNYNFITKDPNLRNFLIDSNNIWLVDTLDIIYTDNPQKKEKSLNKLFQNLKYYI
ncbi:MAG: AarF/UbiB family protein [Thermodesulfobacteriaceae bacterium]|nr:AarF/UbiB family protein [Thermodesulfobacteriaceae bacterium]MCX8040879.1 AarF/UbiB family protein [Thermodesulfobacteriaceae bacterium]MDW8135216.1 RIO1 family regulatory kinase/ATPase [Thermodesulfobacterium sp.]